MFEAERRVPDDCLQEYCSGVAEIVNGRQSLLEGDRNVKTGVDKPYPCNVHCTLSCCRSTKGRVFNIIPTSLGTGLHRSPEAKAATRTINSGRFGIRGLCG